jgi:hypothetical protein
MEIRLRSNGQVMYEGELRSYLLANNGPSFGVLNAEVLESIGADVLLEGAQASGGNHYQVSQRQGVEQIDGKWYTKYVLGPVFTDTPATDTTSAKTAAENEAAYKTAKDTEQTKSMRSSRDEKLKDSDWSQVADAPVDKAVWATYRQALRDVPTQSGFPWEVTWPTQP